MARPSSKEIFSRFTRIFNHRVSFEKRGGKAAFTIPGLQYDDFDRAGYVNIYKVSRIMEHGRLMRLKMLGEDYEDRSQFLMMSQNFTVAENFYQRAALNFPMKFAVEAIAFGRSTYVRQATLSEESTGNSMAMVKHLLVNVDKETRKTCEIPKDLKEKYGSTSNLDPKDVFPNIEPASKPENTFSSTTEVQASDMDMLFHTNQASYINFTLNCAAKAAKAGFFSQIKNDICFYKAKSAHILHKSESFAGDVLDIHVWEDRDDPWKLHSLVHNGESTNYYGVIDYYPGDLSHY